MSDSKGQERSSCTATTAHLISPGTQIVLKVAKPLLGGQEIRPAGSVGLIVESPADNHQPYIVRFTDGQTIAAHFNELALRRNEVEEELGQITDNLWPYVVYRCQVGSKAFGLSDENSDDDLRGIFLPPARLHWSLRRLPERIEMVDQAHDEVYWELEKFLRLALKANPSILETLWTPLVLFADETALELRSLRQAFLSKHIYKTYSGYVLSQLRRMANASKSTGSYKPKHAMHLVRLLHSGIAVLETGEILVEVGEHREALLGIRNGELSFEEVKHRALQLLDRFQEAFERTTLPDQPDYDRVDAYLIRARRKMVDARQHRPT